MIYKGVDHPFFMNRYFQNQTDSKNKLQKYFMLVNINYICAIIIKYANRKTNTNY